MLISPYTPLFFNHHKSDGIDSRCCQMFAPTDRIMVEVIRTADEAMAEAVLHNITKDTAHNITWNSWQINDDTIIDFTEISGLTDGFYYLTIGAEKSKYFQITSNAALLANTTLIQYSNKDNRQRTDVAFFIGGQQYFFDFRVPGGFKDSGWTFGVENEQFVTDQFDIVELYGVDSCSQMFTMGTNIGCPVWFAELLNRLLTCNYVYFDGVRYARKESSVPEITIQMEGLNSFVFNQLLQKVRNLNPRIEKVNQYIIRKVGDGYIGVDMGFDGDMYNYYQRSIK